MTATRIIAVEPQLTALVRKTVAMRDLREAQQGARRLLGAAFATAGLPLGRALTVWRPPHEGRIDYAPGLFVPHAFEAPEGITFFELPAGRAAHLRWVGPYDGLPAAWGRLFADCAMQNWQTAGLNWEVYSPAETPADRIATDLHALLN